MDAGTRRPRVALVGGSLGGLSAALWLREKGCDVEVFERVPVPLEDRGAGIVLNPATVRYLVVHRVLPVARISTSARWVRYLTLDDSVAHGIPCRYRFTAYHLLYGSLLGCFDGERYHSGEECVGFDQDTDQVRVHFASGRVERCDLLVFADGINSIGRRLLVPEVRPQYAGYVAWRGTVDEGMLLPETFAVLSEAITYHLMPDGHLLAYPIPNRDGSVAPGRRITNWLWYRLVAPGTDLDDLLTSHDGVRFGTSTPPGFVQRRHVRRLREEAAVLPPPLAELVRKTTHPFIQAIFDVAVPRMAFGRVCLIGDGAFTLRPHIAAGTAKAAEDAWQLAEAVGACSGDIVAALKRWEPGQLRLGQQALARARMAGERLQHGQWHIGEPLPFGLYQPGDSVLEADGSAANAGFEELPRR